MRRGSLGKDLDGTGTHRQCHLPHFSEACLGRAVQESLCGSLAHALYDAGPGEGQQDRWLCSL